MSTRSFFTITFIGLAAIVANGVKSTMDLASYFYGQNNVLAETHIETQKSNKYQQKITDPIAENPRYGCTPSAANLELSLRKYGDWITLDGMENIKTEHALRWRLVNCKL